LFVINVELVTRLGNAHNPIERVHRRVVASLVEEPLAFRQMIGIRAVV
jgi:hypothetical protein